MIHDTQNDRQFLLQGHTNPITAVAVSTDKRWIATADSGVESMLIIWDADTAAPVKIITLPEDDQGVVGNPNNLTLIMCLIISLITL